MRRWASLITGILFTVLLAAPALAQGGGDGQTTIHVVQRGETLYRIALNYGTSVEAIAQTNSLPDTTSIQVGQRLLIPSSLVNAAIPTRGRHIIQPGETLAHIALRYGSTPAIVAALNNIVNPAQLTVGTALDVSETAPGHPPLTHGYTYTVLPGDTLYRIALRYHVKLDTLLRINELSTTMLIFPGQVLLIPGVETAPALQILPPPLTELTLIPLPAEVGRTSRIRVVSNEPVTLSGTFGDRPLNFVINTTSPLDGITYDALVGLHAMSEPGLVPLVLTLQGTGGSTTYQTRVRVADGGYQSETITLPEDQLRLLDPSVNSAEYDLIASLMSDFTPERFFDGPLGLPAAAPVTSPFGTRRSYNGGPYDRFHTGTDFGGPPGSDIFAPAAGRVVYSSTLDIHGLFTVIDHGWGVYTSYSHQSESFVQPGDMISAGDVIGKIGNSGRSIGPHLHWEVWVNGIEVDGLQWTRFSFP